MRFALRFSFCLLAGTATLVLPSSISLGDEPISYSKDIRPILSQNCFKCHGPDEQTREGGLRLDESESALGAADSGLAAIVPGSIEKSELVRRIEVSDDEQMPPANSNLTLTPAQKELLKKWIQSGAAYQKHWAFEPPRFDAAPAVSEEAWNGNVIDRFIHSKLDEIGLRPQPLATSLEQIRRVYLDLTGLPPTVEQADQFQNDPSEWAYEQIVDQLLMSPDYAERWARRWLDLARYSDTNGYEKDRNRTIWPYRDWVIHAIQDDMPFDQFTIEQLAGDMLPNATKDQRVATGFHRNTMLNEEGGIDPLEFRYYAMADRTATTGTIWLGMTVGCAQCHTHKFDPITHTDYFGMFALLNNADEPDMHLPDQDFEARKSKSQRQIAELKTSLEGRFPVPNDFVVTHAIPKQVDAPGAVVRANEEGVVRVSDLQGETATINFSTVPKKGRFDRVRLEALADDSLPNKGPGLTSHGNFVLTNVSATYNGKPLEFSNATADFSQANYDAKGVIDASEKSGWAIHGEGNWNVNRTLELVLQSPLDADGTETLALQLHHDFGHKHVLGKFRISLLSAIDASEPEEDRRTRIINDEFNSWVSTASKSVNRWTTMRPVHAEATTPKLTILEDQSVLASGDFAKSETYRLKLESVPAGVTGIRLEVLPDERLPGGGPGATYYEGAPGDFFLSEIEIRQKSESLKIESATNSFASGQNKASHCIDGNKQSGWSIDGQQRKRNEAVFRLANPTKQDGELEVELLCERWYSVGLGRFRLSYTTDPVGEANDLGDALSGLLLSGPEAWNDEDRTALKQAFLERSPSLSDVMKQVQNLEKGLIPALKTLVMQERDEGNPRPTLRYHRGEYLQPREAVLPHTPTVLTRQGKSPTNRLEFARWLVSPENPLTARVTVNRSWENFFGRGIVKTSQDFGYQGDTPTHPELLDALAVQFVTDGWSMKKLHKQIVMSRAYRQSSKVDAERLALDPDNRWISRGPRNRLEAEVIRDQALQSAGLLTKFVGGPSVFPAQPSNVTSEGTYGGFAWKRSDGKDRYRRSLYTFSKRTAPFALAATFDAPSGETCIVKREVTNTPLQALTLLNDITFVEASQELGRVATRWTGSDRDKIATMFRRLLIRVPSEAELDELSNFLVLQKNRLEKGELEFANILGMSKSPAAEEVASHVDQASWTLLARVLLNLDEAVTK